MPIYRVFHLVPGDKWRGNDRLADSVMAAVTKGGVDGVIAAGLYREVAHVDCGGIDSVFPATNHIDHDWTTNDSVLAHADNCRSTSVGDLVLDEAGELHVCASKGWRQLEAEQRDAFLALLENKIQILDPGSEQMPSP